MAAVDVSGWSADSPRWTFEGLNATYSIAPGHTSSRLSSGKLPLSATRSISFFSTVHGGVGAVYLRGYTADGRSETTSNGGTGIIGVTRTFDSEYTHYEMILGAFPERGNGGSGDIVDPNQTIQFSSIGSSVAPPVAGAMPGQVTTDANGNIIERGPRPASAKPSIPTSQHDLVRGSKIDKNWYQFLQNLSDSIPTATETELQVSAAVESIPPPEVKFLPSTTITVNGDNTSGYTPRLRAVEPGITTPSVLKSTVDEYGRVRDPVPATTDDLPEGVVNLYFTDERAQDAIGAAIAAGTGDGATLNYNDAANSLGVTNTDKGTVAVNEHVAQGGAAHALAVANGAAGFTSGADKAKLDGVAAGATANSTDAQLRDRATHTGTQAHSTVTMATGRLLGRNTAGAGPAEEITLGTNLAFSGTTLNVDTPSKTTHADLFSDFVVSGLLSPTSANLTSTIAAGTAYVTGLRVVKAAEAFTYAASSDTYEDLASTGVITRVAVANGAAAPAITANNLRLQKVVTDATAVTAVTRLAVLVPSTMLRDRANHTGTQLAATVSDFTSAARAAAVADAIADAVTDVAPSQNAVFDALALKTTNTAAAITGGTINGATIGATTPSTGSFTTVTSSGNGTFNGVKVSKGGGDVSTNVALGSGTLNANTTGSNNVALGVNALSANTTGSDNMAIGTAALSKSNGGANVAIGLAAMLENTTGSENAAIGVDALRNNTTGSRNVGIGYWALRNMDSGVDSVAIGYGALSTNTTGPGNLALGFEAGRGNTTGGNNVMLGFQAGHTDTAANANVSGNINVWIGYWAGPGTTTQLSYSTAIGGMARVTTSNTVVLGRTTDNTVLGATGDDGSGAKLQVTGAIKATENLLCKNAVIGANAASLGGGVGVTFLSNATTVPTTNPVGGGVVYEEAGALKHRGTSGTITTIAPA